MSFYLQKAQADEEWRQSDDNNAAEGHRKKNPVVDFRF